MEYRASKSKQEYEKNSLNKPVKQRVSHSRALTFSLLALSQ